MKIGDMMELEIADVAFGGDGVARHPERVVFVPLVLTGERVEAKLTGITARFARADCRQVLVPSPSRVTPPCPYFGDCGGCRYQHADYPFQLQMKRKQVADILQRIGGIAAPPVESTIPSPVAYGYRNKLTLHGPGRPSFQRSSGGDLLPIESCALAGAAINRKLSELAESELEYDEDLIIRCDADGEVFISRDGAAQTNGTVPASSGPAIIRETLGGLNFQVPVRSFFQVNPGVHELLLAGVVRTFAEGACVNLVDAYCGVGVFALGLAGGAKNIIGIEYDPAAVSCAVENAKQLGCVQVRFRQGQVETALRPALRECSSAPTCVILDPPRAGCADRIIRLLLEERPRQVLYLSCAPPVLARDLKRLLAGGYELRRVAPFDMFPQTAHVEVLAELVG
jgi:23S rRNA (uracil1939-C5)-methyltransferase